MPSASIRRRRRLSASTAGSGGGPSGSKTVAGAGRGSVTGAKRRPLGAGSVESAAGRLAQEGLPAGPVADDEDCVLLGGVPGSVQENRTARRGAVPDPPAVVLVERRRLGRQCCGQPIPLRREPSDHGSPRRRGLTRVRIILPDVRSHRAPQVGARWRISWYRARQMAPPWPVAWRALTG